MPHKWLTDAGNATSRMWTQKDGKRCFLFLRQVSCWSIHSGYMKNMTHCWTAVKPESFFVPIVVAFQHLEVNRHYSVASKLYFHSSDIKKYSDVIFNSGENCKINLPQIPPMCDRITQTQVFWSSLFNFFWHRQIFWTIYPEFPVIWAITGKYWITWNYDNSMTKIILSLTTCLFHHIATNTILNLISPSS